MMNEVTFCCSRFSHVAKFLILLNKIFFFFFFSSISFCIFTLSNVSICIVYSSECFIDVLSRFFSPFFSFFFFWQRAAILKVVCFALDGGWVANIMSEHIINLSLSLSSFFLFCFHGSVRFTRIYQGQSRSRRLTLNIPRILYINIFKWEKDVEGKKKLH